MSWEDRDYNQGQFGSGGFGGRRMGGMAGGLSGGGASMVMWLLGINVAVFLLDAILGGSQRGAGIAPYVIGYFSFDKAAAHYQVWRLITYQFVHANFWHIFGNMLLLYFFGPLMENWWGSRRFLAFYLLCGMSGAVVYTLFALGAPAVIFDMDLLAAKGIEATKVPLVGASGACFGILVGCAVLYPKQRVMLLIPPIPMSMRTLAIVAMVVVGLSLIFGADNAGGEAAHLGGAVLGIVLIRFPNMLNFADNLGAVRTNFQVKRMQHAAERERRREADQIAEVDRVLDKVREKGLASLTESEKRILQRETDRKRGQ